MISVSLISKRDSPMKEPSPCLRGRFRLRLSGAISPVTAQLFDDPRSVDVQDLQKTGQRKSFAEKIVYVDGFDGSVTIFHDLRQSEQSAQAG